jgi:hypothetical protein
VDQAEDIPKREYMAILQDERFLYYLRWDARDGRLCVSTPATTALSLQDKQYSHEGQSALMTTLLNYRCGMAELSLANIVLEVIGGMMLTGYLGALEAYDPALPLSDRSRYSPRYEEARRLAMSALEKGTNAVALRQLGQDVDLERLSRDALDNLSQRFVSLILLTLVFPNSTLTSEFHRESSILFLRMWNSHQSTNYRLGDLKIKLFDDTTGPR